MLAAAREPEVLSQRPQLVLGRHVATHEAALAVHESQHCGHTPQRAGARSRARGMASQRLDDGRSEVRRYDFGGTFRRQACAQVGAVYVRLELRAEVEAEVRLLVLSHV